VSPEASSKLSGGLLDLRETQADDEMARRDRLTKIQSRTSHPPTTVLWHGERPHAWAHRYQNRPPMPYRWAAPMRHEDALQTAGRMAETMVPPTALLDFHAVHSCATVQLTIHALS